MVVGGVFVVIRVAVAVGVPLLLQRFVGGLAVFRATPFESRHLTKKNKISISVLARKDDVRYYSNLDQSFEM